MKIKDLYSIILLNLLILPIFSSASWILGSIKTVDNQNLCAAPTIYYDGHIIQTETNTSTVHFEVPRAQRQSGFFILITDSVSPIAKKNDKGAIIYNTIDYLKVPTGQSYKLFHVILRAEKTGQTITYFWVITPMALDYDGRIPDQTIIINYFPELVDRLEGGDTVSLPTIYVRSPAQAIQSIVTEDMHERIVKMQLASLDTNTIHTPIKKMIAQTEKKIIIAFSS